MGAYGLCVIKRGGAAPGDLQQGGIPILRYRQARHSTICF